MNSIRLPKNYLLVGSLGALLLGLATGIIAKQGDVEILFSLSSFLEPLGTLWINSLRMLVLPLLISYIMMAVASFSEVKSTFRIGGGAVFAHLLFLCLGIAVMLIIVPPLVAQFEVTPAIREALQSQNIQTPTVSREVDPAAGIGGAISHVIPSNIFRAAVNEDILPIFVATLLFALALTRVSEDHRKPILDLFKSIIEILHVLIRWILLAMPYAVFILVFSMATRAGLDLFTALAYFVILFCGLLIVLTLFLYVVTPILGGVSVTRFARAAAPAQVMAVGTRSSMVCLPALIEGARDRLGLPAGVVGIVMPLAVSMFKINKAVSGPLQIFFLSHLYGIPLEPLAVAVFFMAYIPTSFSSPGIPSGGFFVSLPLYIALGIPVEGVVLLRTVDAIPDIFKTLANVTEDMSVATLVSRFSPESSLVAASSSTH
jgi:proton glutamate symport protein